MNEYLIYYYDLLINTKDIETIKSFLPNLTLDKTNQIINMLIEKLKEEINLAIALEDETYQKHLEQVISLLENCKEKENVYESLLPKNIIIFSDEFIKSLKNINDSSFYSEILASIKCLESKEWMQANILNPQKYRRLHGTASGLSEVKTKNTRLIHIPINGDFWFVAVTLKKEGNNKKKHRADLDNLKNYCKTKVKKILKDFSNNGKIEYEKLLEYAKRNNKYIIEELNKWEDKKNGKQPGI